MVSSPNSSRNSMKQIQSSEELMLRSLAPARKVKKVEL
jgi:hypothetical protein